MSWSSLSEDVWSRTLHFLPYSERLGSCSRVSWTLYRAAAAATQEVRLSGCSAQRSMGLQEWMLHHGHHITSVDLSAGSETLTQLPCPNLRHLKLTFMTMQLGASSTQPGVLHSCMGLTKLHLIACVHAGQNGLAPLSALVSLQHLELHISNNNRARGQMPSTVLQHLQGLTYLALRDHTAPLLTTRSLEHISCLVNLQELHIDSKVLLSPSTTPGISRLTALTALSMERGQLDPVCLQDCTQLQELVLTAVTITSAAGADGAAQQAALHNLVGRLQQLQSLRLCELQYDWHVAAAAYSSLTTSSKLQRLFLTVGDLPPGIWRHVFPPDRQLPALQEFVVRFNSWIATEPPPPAALTTDDISCLVSCCPGLRNVDIDVQPGSQLAVFAQAAGLTSLSLVFLHAEDFDSLRALSGLIGLQGLYVGLAGPITPCDLLRLTALTGLTALSIDTGTAPEFEGADDVDLSLTLVREMARPLWGWESTVGGHLQQGRAQSACQLDSHQAAAHDT